MPQLMRISRAGIELIKSFEGFTPRTLRIDDTRWVIGFGHIRHDNDQYRVSRDEAEQILREYDLPPYEQLVLDHTFTPLHQGAFDALVSFAFNIGKEAFLKSDVLSLLNAGDTLAAAEAMSAWRKAKIKGRTIVVDALVRRRAAEKAMFLSDPAGPASAPSAMVQPTRDPAAQMPSARDRTVIVETAVSTDKPKAVEYKPSEDRRAKPEAIIAAPRPLERLTRRFEEALGDLGESEAQASQMPPPQIVDPNSGPTPEEITAAISELVNGVAAEDDAGTEEEPKISADVPGIDLEMWDDEIEPDAEPASNAAQEVQQETPRFERTLGEDEFEPIDLPEPGDLPFIDDLEPIQINENDVERAVRRHEEFEGTAEFQQERNWGPFAFLAIIGAGIFAWGVSLFGAQDETAGQTIISLELFMVVAGALLFLVMAYYFVREFVKSDRR